MASGQRQEIHQAPRLGACGGERLPRGERLHLSGPRHWPAAIDLLRRSDRERRTRPPSSGLVVAGNLRACRLSDAPISAGEVAGIPPAPEGLEKPPLDSAAMTTETPAPVEGPCSSGGGQDSSTTPPICYVCFTSDSSRPECAISGRSQTACRTGSVDAATNSSAARIHIRLGRGQIRPPGGRGIAKV